VVRYPIADGLREMGCKHCAALFVMEERVGSRPTAHDRNATVTFIGYEGRV